jgi:hypothetical protein
MPIGVHARLVLDRLRQVAPQQVADVLRPGLDQPHDHVDGGQHEQLGVPVLDAEHPAHDRVVAPHDDVHRSPDEQLGHDVGQLVHDAERDGRDDGPPVPPGVTPQPHERRGGGVVGTGA